jgi:hypothetical protein
MVSPKAQGVDRQTLALVSGARTAALAALAGSSISSGYADPGLTFFMALAVVGACREGELAASARRRSFPLPMLKPAAAWLRQVRRSSLGGAKRART